MIENAVSQETCIFLDIPATKKKHTLESVMAEEEEEEEIYICSSRL
jgi:hypothetical protein